MADQVTGDPEHFSVHTLQSVEAFLGYLLPDQEHWSGAKQGELAYRGQAASVWGLVPKALRDREVVGYEGELAVLRRNRVVPQARAEFGALWQFVKAADRAGLGIGEAGRRLLLSEDPRRVFDDPNWEYGWPQHDVLEPLALAQHHGVPTRLLDFTENPLVAAYFAAEAAWDKKKRRRLTGRERRFLAVWVIDLRFVRAIDSVSHRYPERVAEVRLPRGNNSYLHAQGGFFLMDRGANDVMHYSTSRSLDQAISERATFWHNGSRLSGHNIDDVWFDEKPIRQVRLRTSLTGELLRELQVRGITRGTMMPSLDRVVEGLELLRSIP